MARPLETVPVSRYIYEVVLHSFEEQYGMKPTIKNIQNKLNISGDNRSKKFWNEAFKALGHSNIDSSAVRTTNTVSLSMIAELLCSLKRLVDGHKYFDSKRNIYKPDPNLVMSIHYVLMVFSVEKLDRKCNRILMGQEISLRFSKIIREASFSDVSRLMTLYKAGRYYNTFLDSWYPGQIKVVTPDRH